MNTLLFTALLLTGTFISYKCYKTATNPKEHYLKRDSASTAFIITVFWGIGLIILFALVNLK